MRFLIHVTDDKGGFLFPGRVMSKIITWNEYPSWSSGPFPTWEMQAMGRSWFLNVKYFKRELSSSVFFHAVETSLHTLIKPDTVFPLSSASQLLESSPDRVKGVSPPCCAFHSHWVKTLGCKVSLLTQNLKPPSQGFCSSLIEKNKYKYFKSSDKC